MTTVTTVTLDASSSGNKSGDWGLLRGAGVVSTYADAGGSFMTRFLSGHGIEPVEILEPWRWGSKDKGRKGTLPEVFHLLKTVLRKRQLLG